MKTHNPNAHAQPYLTPGALTEYIKRKFDNDPHLQQVHVVGEISNYRPRATHQYFSLKDERAVINVVMFKSAFSKVKFKLEDGMKVRAIGRVSVFEKSGQYQLYIDHLEPDGIGSLYLAFEQIKEKFLKAGLFDLPKKPIPKYPQNIAVITSESGSVIHDIRTTLYRRNPLVQYHLFPTKVQGDDAPDLIIEQFKNIEKQTERYDLVILARGGGSIEDLWAFNNEALAMEIINCSLPVITSIGHETDTTLADLVSDCRAATPTAAAEIATTPLNDILLQLSNAAYHLTSTLNHQISQYNQKLQHIQQHPLFTQRDQLLAPYLQRLDMANERLSISSQLRYQNEVAKLEQYRYRLQSQSVQQMMQQSGIRLKQYCQLMDTTFNNIIQLKTQKMIGLKQIITAYDPNQYLQRGYAMVLSEGQVVTSIQQVAQEQRLNIQLKDGYLDVEVKSILSQDEK